MTGPRAEDVQARAVLHALAEPRREEIIRLLTEKQLAARDLIARTGMAQPLVSHHLKVLREAGLVESTICERLRVYRLRADTLRELSDRLRLLAERAAVTGSRPAC